MTHVILGLRGLATVLSIVAFAFFSFPHALVAQESSSTLRATIRSALLSDPRTSGLSSVQIDALVDLLSAEATKEGITSHDIEWRPETPSTQDSGIAEPACGNVPSFLCALNAAFGFDGSDLTISIGLGATSAILLLLIGLTMEMNRRSRAQPPL